MLHLSPPPPSLMCVCVCVCSVSGLVCLQIVFTVDRATQTRTQPKGNKSNAPTLLLRFYTANKHTSHTHTPTHMLSNMCTMCGKQRRGEGRGRARSSLHSFYVLKEPTDTPVQPDPNVRADVPSLSLSLCLALSRSVCHYSCCIRSSTFAFLAASSASLCLPSLSCPAGFYYFWLVCCITKM